jgi:thiol-disulfide isomerase/thioredoxin
VDKWLFLWNSFLEESLLSKYLNPNGFYNNLFPWSLESYRMFMSYRFHLGRRIAVIILTMWLQQVAAQEATVVKFGTLQKILDTESNQIQIINFWATWCAPCVKELPLLEKLNSQKNLNVKITLVSLDFSEKVGNVNAFIKRKNIRSEVLLLDEIDYNSWIDKVDKKWSGAIPATLMFNPKTKKRKFLEKGLKEGELEKLIADLR